MKKENLKLVCTCDSCPKGYFLLYKDTQSEDVYSDNELEFIEYYGG